jgi:23S rRNA (adenine2503-C2)-methyltransferase
MKIVASTGTESVAVVYIVDLGESRLVECVEAVQPPLPRDRKWVLLISTMCGCPVKCIMCDAGDRYQGKLSKADIFGQIDFLVQKRFPDRIIPSAQFKIQFARMGEPALNDQVLDVLDELPERYDAPGLMPSISTIAPFGTRRFFDRLLAIKQARYSGGRFQFQFSLHTTDPHLRDRIVPVRKWALAEMAEYGDRFHQAGDRKITLNFALAQGNPIDPAVLLSHFDPARFLIKITPLNPTYRAAEHGLTSYIDPMQTGGHNEIAQKLCAAGYEVIVSIGECEENYIGSNCGQYVMRHLQSSRQIQDGYTYPLNHSQEFMKAS